MIRQPANGLVVGDRYHDSEGGGIAGHGLEDGDRVSPRTALVLDQLLLSGEEFR